MSVNIKYLWKDRKRYLGMPLSFTRYQLSDERRDSCRESSP